MKAFLDKTLIEAIVTGGWSLILLIMGEWRSNLNRSPVHHRANTRGSLPVTFSVHVLWTDFREPWRKRRRHQERTWNLPVERTQVDSKPKCSCLEPQTATLLQIGTHEDGEGSGAWSTSTLVVHVSPPSAGEDIIATHVLISCCWILVYSYWTWDWIVCWDCCFHFLMLKPGHYRGHACIIYWRTAELDWIRVN